MNSFVTIPILVILSVIVNNYDVQFSFAVEDLPDVKTVVFSIAFCMVCEDCAFHFTHRFLHWRLIYPYIHKIHHTYATTISIAAEYSHPLEYFFGAAIPASIGALILGKRMHYATYLIWGIIRVAESMDGHCGYEFSWSPYRLIPFSTSASYHDFHHSHNVGNFSSMFSFWDTIFNTNKTFY